MPPIGCALQRHRRRPRLVPVCTQRESPVPACAARDGATSVFRCKWARPRTLARPRCLHHIHVGHKGTAPARTYAWRAEAFVWTRVPSLSLSSGIRLDGRFNSPCVYARCPGAILLGPAYTLVSFQRTPRRPPEAVRSASTRRLRSAHCAPSALLSHRQQSAAAGLGTRSHLACPAARRMQVHYHRWRLSTRRGAAVRRGAGRAGSEARVVLSARDAGLHRSC